jgi:hypothetical protein
MLGFFPIGSAPLGDGENTSLDGSHTLLVSNSVLAENAVVAAALLSQLHVLSGASVATENVVVSVTELGQNYFITPEEFVSNAINIAATALTQRHGLSADSVVSATPVGFATIVSEQHRLNPENIQTAFVAVETTSLAEVTQILPDSVGTGSAIVEATSLVQNHGLVPGSVLGQISVGSAILVNEIHLTPLSLNAEALRIEYPALKQNTQFVAESISVQALIVPSLALVQQHSLVSSGLLANSLIGLGEIKQRHLLSFDDVASIYPEIGQTGFIAKRRLSRLGDGANTAVISKTTYVAAVSAPGAYKAMLTSSGVKVA